MKRDGRSIVLRNHFPSPPAGKSAITTAGDVFYSLLPNIARPIQRTELSPQGYIYIYIRSFDFRNRKVSPRKLYTRKPIKYPFLFLASTRCISGGGASTKFIRIDNKISQRSGGGNIFPHSYILRSADLTPSPPILCENWTKIATFDQMRDRGSACRSKVSSKQARNPRDTEPGLLSRFPNIYMYTIEEIQLWPSWTNCTIQVETAQ